MAEGGLHHGFGAHTAVFGQQGLLQRAAVHPDADGDILLAASVGHRLHPVFAADVARVDAHLVRSGGNGLQGQLVVEVDIHHQWQRTLLLDLTHRLGRRHIGHGHPDDLASGGGQLPNLAQGSLHVVGAGVGHRLDGHRRAAAHQNVAYFDLLGHLCSSSPRGVTPGPHPLFVKSGAKTFGCIITCCTSFVLFSI